MALKRLRERGRASEHAPRDPFRLLERRYGHAEIIKRGAVGPVESQRVSPPHREREMMTLSEKASRHGNHFAEQCLGFFKAPQIMEGRSVVVGFSKAPPATFADESYELPKYTSD